MAQKLDKPPQLTAKKFLKRLQGHGSRAEAENTLRYFKAGEGEYGAGDKFIGVRMGTVFALAKEFIEMPLDEVEKLLDSPIHEARASAVSIMAQRSKRRKTSDAERKQLVDLYLRRHDRINNGTWSIWARSTSSASTCAIIHAMSCTNLHVRKTFGSGELLSYRPVN